MVQWRTLFDQKEHAIYSNVLLSGVRAIDLRFCSPDNFRKSIRCINFFITARLTIFPKISYETYTLMDDQ